MLPSSLVLLLFLASAGALSSPVARRTTPVMTSGEGGGMDRRTLLGGVGATAAAAGLRVPIVGPLYTPTADLTGKTMLITGANTGLGFESAARLAAAGATVVVTCRSEAKAADTIARLRERTGSQKLDAFVMDLADLNSVTQCANDFKARYDRLSVLMNNAGVMLIPDRRLTKDGFELTFGTNHLGHFALTANLLDRLRRTPESRLVTVSSTAHLLAPKIDFDNLQGEKDYQPWGSYCQSKLANVYFAKEVQRRLDSVGKLQITGGKPGRPTGFGDVTSVSLHPGVVRTELARYAIEGLPNNAATKVLGGALLAPAVYFTKGVERGAATQTYLAAEPTLPAGAKGAFFDNCKVAYTNPAANDELVARQLWEVSEELTGAKFNLPEDTPITKATPPSRFE